MMDPSLRDQKLLVVGAGGIGCELLKNLVLTGFTRIEVIDLDTIELSNLNRQFLFQKHHVGKSKSMTARESVLKYACAHANGTEITSHHDSVMSPKYSVDYFRRFALVLNALDNRAARSHVNRLCLAAEVPLIESGSAGYLGQITLISRGRTECYDCLPKAAPKTFPGCTIRNTPSEPIHCIVWAKHLFNQLFGAEDPDEAVSPDGHDPENMAEAGQNALANITSEKETERKSTRQWAKETSYNPIKLFTKLFNDDIKYLLSMSKLWEKRRPPTPLNYSESESNSSVPGLTTGTTSSTSGGFASLKLWTLGECVRVFVESVQELSGRLETESLLHWDKDDEVALNFVASAANLRSAVFGIAQKSKFEVKSLAGNIIPAIASTNAIVAGLIVIQAIKVLAAKFDECRTVYLRDKPILNKLVVSTNLQKPNPKCYVCASKPELAIRLDLNKFTIKQLETKILKQELNMVQPDVEIDDGSGRIILSSEEGETEENNDKVLSFFGIADQTRLKCDDFFQNYELRIILHHSERAESAGPDVKEYEIVSDGQMVKEIQEAVQKETTKKLEEETRAQKRKLERDSGDGDDSNDIIIESSNQKLSPGGQKRSYEAAFSGEETDQTSTTNSGGSSVPVNGSETASKKHKAVIEIESGSNNDDLNDNSNSINDASDVISDEEENSNSVSRPSFSSFTNQSAVATVQSSSAAVIASSRGTDISKSTIVEEPDEIVLEDDDCIIEESDSNQLQLASGNVDESNTNSSDEYALVRTFKPNHAHNNHYTNGNGEESSSNSDVIECSSEQSGSADPETQDNDVIEINEDERSSSNN